MALHLGKTVRQLLSELDSEELSEWLAYDQLEPLPDAHWDSGMMASTVVNMFSKTNRRYKPTDFMPHYRISGRHDPEQDMAILDAMIAGQEEIPISLS